MIKRYILTKRFLFIVVLGVCLKFSLSYLNETLDDNGICWSEARALTDKELYQNAMRHLIQLELNESDLSRGDRPGMERAESEGAFHCRPLDCNVWVGPPLTKKEVHALRKQFNQENMYEAAWRNKRINGIAAKLGWKELPAVGEAGSFSPRNNEKSIIITIVGSASYYATDCCDIYTNADVEKAQPKFSDVRGHPPYTNNYHRYLLAERLSTPEINLRFDDRDPNRDKYKKELVSQRQISRLYALNACGFIQDIKVPDYITTLGNPNPLRKYVKIRQEYPIKER